MGRGGHTHTNDKMAKRKRCCEKRENSAMLAWNYPGLTCMHNNTHSIIIIIYLSQRRVYYRILFHLSFVRSSSHCHGILLIRLLSDFTPFSFASRFPACYCSSSVFLCHSVVCVCERFFDYILCPHTPFLFILPLLLCLSFTLDHAHVFIFFVFLFKL